jgi:transcriptional regulator with XRE-family HTH domain
MVKLTPRPKGGFDSLLRRRIVANMRRAMVELKIRSGRELARRIEVNPATVTRYLAGKRTPGLDILYRLHRGLGISSDYFLDTPSPAETSADRERARDGPQVKTEKVPALR